MKMSACQISVDRSGKELISHGTKDYPLSFCRDDLGENEVPWHWHDELEMVFVEQGTALIAAGDAAFTVTEGEGFFVNTGVLHGCWNQGSISCRFHSLVFHANLIGGDADSIFMKKYMEPLLKNRAIPCIPLCPCVSWQAEALQWIENAWQANFREQMFYEFETREALARVLMLIIEGADKQGEPIRAHNVRQEERLKQMMRFIEDNLGERITVAQIAASANISESECLRCFRQVMRVSPAAYLRASRIRRAAQLLRNRQEKISGIAAACGFEDMSYFSKVFRTEKGCTPSEYRRMYL